jgi:hypothetical protein
MTHNSFIPEVHPKIILTAHIKNNNRTDAGWQFIISSNVALTTTFLTALQVMAVTIISNNQRILILLIFKGLLLLLLPLPLPQ